MKASAIGATGIGIGFVAASEPVMAAAIETDFKGIKAGEQMIPVGSLYSLREEESIFWPVSRPVQGGV